MKNLIKNKKQSGFGLIQVVIAASLMSFISVGMAGLIVSQANQVSYLEDKMSFMNAKRSVEDLVGLSTESCTKSILNVKIPKKGARVNFVIKDKKNKVVFDPKNKTKNSYDKIKIKKIYIKDISAFSSKTGEGEVDLVVEATRERKGGGPAELKPIVIRKTVNIDNKSKKLSNCLDDFSSADTDDACVIQSSKSKNSKHFSEVGRLASGMLQGKPETRKYRLDKDTEAVSFDLSMSASSHSSTGTSSGDTINCPARQVSLVIYPGQTKIGKYTLPKGGEVKVVTKNTGSYTYKSKNSKGQTKKKTGYTSERALYYAGRKLAVQKSGASKKSCRTLSLVYKNLGGNQLPPKCGVKNYRSAASSASNLSAKIFKLKK